MVVFMACAPSSDTGNQGATSDEDTSDPAAADSTADEPEIDEDFDLDALVEAAKADGSLTVYDSTGKIETMAENFEAKYGIPAEGIKQDSSQIVEKVIRESQAGNVTADVAVIGDIASVSEELLPQGIVETWAPPDLIESIPESMRSPLIMINSAEVLVYNTAVHDECPVDNFWALTDPELRGSGGLVLQDPVNAPDYADWWSQMSTHADDELRAAYEELYGEPLETDEPTATHEWIKRLAQSQPSLQKGDEESAEAVGAPGQDDPPIGLMSTAKFRNIEDKGYDLGLCADLTPIIGFAKPKAITMAVGTEHPNAAKLFIHFALTEEGIAPQTKDGKISSNSDIPPHPDDPMSMVDHVDKILFFNTSTASQDWQNRQEFQDLWRLNHN